MRWSFCAATRKSAVHASHTEHVMHHGAQQFNALKGVSCWSMAQTAVHETLDSVIYAYSCWLCLTFADGLVAAACMHLSKDNVCRGSLWYTIIHVGRRAFITLGVPLVPTQIAQLSRRFIPTFAVCRKWPCSGVWIPWETLLSETCPGNTVLTERERQSIRRTAFAAQQSLHWRRVARVFEFACQRSFPVNADPE